MQRITEVQAQGLRGGLDDGEEEDQEDHQLLSQRAALMASMDLFTGPPPPGPPLCAPAHCSQCVLSNGQVCKSDDSPTCISTVVLLLTQEIGNSQVCSALPCRMLAPLLSPVSPPRPIPYAVLQAAVLSHSPRRFAVLFPVSSVLFLGLSIPPFPPAPPLPTLHARKLVTSTSVLPLAMNVARSGP